MADPHPPQHTHPPAHTRGRASLISNILAIAGFILLAVVVIWGLIHLARLSSPWFASLFDSKNDASVIQVMAPVNAKADIPFKVVWKHTADAEGMYAFTYQCQTGLQYKVPGPDGQRTIPCGAAYSVGTTSKEISVLPTLTGTTTAKSPITILFMPRETGTQARGDAVVNITAGSPEPLPEPSPKPGPAPKPRPAAPADLSVRIVSAYTEGYGTAVVVFDIANDGASSTGMWFFEAQLPTAQPYTYISPAQASLAPGAHITNTLRFTQAMNGSVFISVDPANAVRESNEGNNTASQYIGAGVPTQYPYRTY